MSKLQEIRIDDDTIIYMEAPDDLEAPANGNGNGYGNGYGNEYYQEGERGRVGKGGMSASASEQVAQSFKAMENTIKTYTRSTLNAFRDVAFADVKRVTLEFGVNVSGMGGIPYIASGTAGCNIKVTVECSFESGKPY